jgi:hypothetical protein
LPIIYCKHQYGRTKKEKEENKKDVQKEDTLQPVTTANSKLDKELQEWEVDSTMSGDCGGFVFNRNSCCH